MNNTREMMVFEIDNIFESKGSFCIQIKFQKVDEINPKINSCHMVKIYWMEYEYPVQLSSR